MHAIAWRGEQPALIHFKVLVCSIAIEKVNFQSWTHGLIDPVKKREKLLMSMS
jgi:hypothetical protein